MTTRAALRTTHVSSAVVGDAIAADTLLYAPALEQEDSNRYAEVDRP